jgi:hypothetical protein
MHNTHHKVNTHVCTAALRGEHACLGQNAATHILTTQQPMHNCGTKKRRPAPPNSNLANPGNAHADQLSEIVCCRPHCGTIKNATSPPNPTAVNHPQGSQSAPAVGTCNQPNSCQSPASLQNGTCKLAPPFHCPETMTRATLAAMHSGLML